MNYESPSMEVTTFEVRGNGESEGFSCPTMTPDVDL